MIAEINFNVIPGTEYIISYKKTTDSVWIIAPNNPAVSSPFSIDGIEFNTWYDFRIESPCGITTVQKKSNESPVIPIWIEDTFVCEQDEPFVLDDTYTGFSSPQWLYWDEISQRYYVGDVDDVNGNVYYFDPTTITGYGSRIVVPGIVDKIQAVDFDSEGRKMWLVGDDSNGAKVVDISTNTVSTVNYGSNGAYHRTLCKILGDTVYCNDVPVTSGPSNMILIDKETNVVTSTLLNTSITQGSIYFTRIFTIFYIHDEIWVCASSRSNGNIGVYNSTLSNTPSVITLPGISTWTGGIHWQTHFYDSEKDRFYSFDAGSNQYIVLDATTKSVVASHTINNRGGKTNTFFGFIINPLTGDLYLSGESRNTPTDTTPIPKTYKINRDTYEIEYIYPSQKFANLVLKPSTNELWGIDPKLIYSQGGAWNTDGLILKYLG